MVPFFLLAPMWLLCLLAGVACCFSRRLRPVAPYLILTPTSALAVSPGLSAFMLWIGPRILPSGTRWASPVLIAAYFASIVIGGLAGLAGGLLATRQISRGL